MRLTYIPPLVLKARYLSDCLLHQIFLVPQQVLGGIPLYRLRVADFSCTFICSMYDLTQIRLCEKFTGEIFYRQKNIPIYNIPVRYNIHDCIVCVYSKCGLFGLQFCGKPMHRNSIVSPLHGLLSRGVVV